MNTPARQPRAFTLAEILVVVVIMGIAAAVVVPQIGTHDDLRAAAAARMLMADLLYAQNRAITTQTRHYVTFTTTGTQNYRLVTSMTPLIDIPHPLTKASAYVATFGDHGTTGLDDASLGTVSFEGSRTLAFDELGAPYYYDAATAKVTPLSVSGGSTIPIKCGKFTVTVSIEPFTGEIKVN